MKRAAKAIFAAVLAAFSFTLPASAQQPGFPQNMPPNTVYGRSGISTGPGQAIPFSVIVQVLNNIANTWPVLQTFTGGTTAPLNDGAAALLASNNTTKTALSIYSPFSNPANSAIYDTGRFVLDLESVVGGTITQADALGAYAYCNVPLGIAPATGNCVASFGFAALAVANASGWGANFVCTDNTTNTNYSGTQNRKCIGTEINIRVYDTGGTAQATGLLIGLDGTGTSTSTIYGVDLEAGAAAPKYSFGFNCGLHATAIGCLNVGPATTGASASQALVFEYNFTGSAQQAMTLVTPSDGGFSFTTTDAAIDNAFDWSAVTINQCTIKIVHGCILDGSGNLAFIAGVGTGTVKAAGLISTADPGGTVSTNTITSVNSSTISSGTGTVKMSSANSANNTGWLKFFCGTAVCWVPAWVTNAP